MHDFFEDLHKKQDGEEDAFEPSFTLHEFKKWLSKQKKPKNINKEKTKEVSKEEFKEKMKKKFKD